MRRSLFLSLLFLSAPLAGCAGPEPAAPRLDGFHATFTGAAGTLALSFGAGPWVADRFGTLRPAHALRIGWTGVDGQRSNDTLHVDGAGMPVRSDTPCLDAPCRYAQADWSALGVPPPFGLWLPQKAPALAYTVDGVPLRQAVQPRADGALLRVDLGGDSRYLLNRYLSMPGVFWYAATADAVPVRLHAIFASGGQPVWLNRTAFRDDGPLADLPAWPGPAQQGAPLPRPASLIGGQAGQPFAGAPWPSPGRVLSALGDASPEANRTLSGAGCLLRFAEQRNPGAPADTSSAALVLLQNATGGLRESRLQATSANATLRLARSVPVQEPWADCRTDAWPPAAQVTLAAFARAAAALPVSANGSVNGWSLHRVFAGGHRPDSPQRSLELLTAVYVPASAALGGSVAAYVPYSVVADTADGSWLEAIVHPSDLARMDHGALPRI